ncbi:MAG: hypothetical protein IT379_35110 [Deltaproteobacteria bacterium]|nr:hypothetical protein [Deltaproteobacteria bacterium]
MTRAPVRSLVEGQVRMPPPAERTAAYGAIVIETPRTAIVPPAAEDWVPPPQPDYRVRKQTLAPLVAPVFPAPPAVPVLPGPMLAALETTHVGAPPPRLTPDDRVTSPAMIPAAATYRPPAPRGESRTWLALSAMVFVLGLAAAAGVFAWILVRHLAP